MRFYLGTHETSWLGKTDVPLFVSRRRLARIKALPRALGYWALDSGGFTELSMFGRWETSAEQYADEAETYKDRIGNLEFAAIQDWMCEPWILKGTAYAEGTIKPDLKRLAKLVSARGTHFQSAGASLQITEIPFSVAVEACPDLTLDQQAEQIRLHQARTIASWLELKSLAPNVPWAPVLQGWHVDDYLSHVEQYKSAGVDLTRLETVGVGSVCRRQATQEAEDIFYELKHLGIRCHGFGLKTQGLVRCATVLASADSMAWSFRARRSKPLAGCPHKSCANCMRYALLWRERILDAIAVSRPRPRRLWEAFAGIVVATRTRWSKPAKPLKPAHASDNPRPLVPLPGQRSLFDAFEGAER